MLGYGNGFYFGCPLGLIWVFVVVVVVVFFFAVVVGCDGFDFGSLLYGFL